MIGILIGAPFIGILTALVSVVFEQFLALVANIVSQKEIVLDVYTHLNFFLIASAIIEESLKYFSAVFALRGYLCLRRLKFIAASALAGLFFGGTEIYFVLLAKEKKIWEIYNLDRDTLFSLSAIVCLHILTYLLISVFIASQSQQSNFQTIKIIILPTLIHLLFNFLIIYKGSFTNWLVEIVLGITLIISLFTIAFNFRRLD